MIVVSFRWSEGIGVLFPFSFATESPISFRIVLSAPSISLKLRFPSPSTRPRRTTGYRIGLNPSCVTVDQSLVNWADEAVGRPSIGLKYQSSLHFWQ